MESSSEDDFAWTNTSSDKSDSEAMAHKEESDVDKPYKKKLLKKLFGENGDLDDPQVETPRRKKKKIKHEKDSPAPSVKEEPESDARVNGDAAAERWLRLKVKQEQAGQPAPRPRRRSASAGSAGTAHTAHTAPPGRSRPHKKKAKREQDEPDAGEPPPKKKKKHKRETSVSNEAEPIVDKFEAEETVVQTRRPAAPAATASAPTEKPFTSKEFVDTDSDSADERRAPAPVVPVAPVARVPSEKSDAEFGTRSPERFPKRALNIRERITFEEESQDRSESESEERTPGESESEERAPGESVPSAPVGLQRFLRAHAHLRPAEGWAGGGAAPGADDDVWLVRAPRSLCGRALAGAALALGARCKLAAAGGAYEAEPAPCGARVAVLLPAGRVRGVRVRGALQLRVRVPRARAPPGAPPEGPAAVPLPATRLRHPLLGADYMRALAPRPPAPARARADACDAIEAPDRREKKKKKKKEKRERECDEAAAPSRQARREGTELWDSAAAIEESLFSF